jgi:hydrogenase nickel incorporation protein HypA/HybF
MHELALADAVVKAAVRAADDAGIRRIDRIEIAVGELQQIEPDLFTYSLTSVLGTADPRVAGVVFDVRTVNVAFGCRACGTGFGRSELEAVGDETALEAMHLVPELAHAYVRCPACGSPDFEITEGRGVVLERIEGEGAGERG